jgi:enoyl-CoA hydratase/carnithine racemase
VLEIKRQGDVLIVALAAVEKRNAFTPELVDALSSLDCSEPGALVITNKGPAFSSGLDLKIFLTNKSTVKNYLYKINNLVEKLINCNKNTLIYLNGDAYGFGVELTYFADVVAAARPDVRLSLQGVKFGVFPPYTIALAKLLGPTTVRSLLAGPITAEAAVGLGLVHYIAPLEEVLATAFRPPGHIFKRARAHRELLREGLAEAPRILDELAELAEDSATRSLISRFFKD